MMPMTLTKTRFSPALECPRKLNYARDKKAYYDEGDNNHSKRLRRQYGAPVYGTKEMPSLNFQDWAWVKDQDGLAHDPYAMLDPLFDDPVLQEAIAAAGQSDAEEAQSFIDNGGAAIIAYDQLQQVGLTEAKRHRITRELLRYCELDTLAMVMVYQSLTGHGLGSHP